MRATMGLGLISAVILGGAVPAHAQYSRSDDPCSPPAMSTNTMVALIGALRQHGRDEACAAERRAQWDEYNARQKAAKDAADAERAHAQEQQAEAGRQKELTAREAAAEQARSRRQHAAADARARHVMADRQARAEREAAAGQDRQRQSAALLVQAENAPGNHCREPDLARRVLTAWNGLDAMRAAGVKAVDIEHLTTVSFDPQNRAVACHGVFVTSQGWKIVGTATVKTNVAGDPMFVWERDGRQSEADDTASRPGADTPGMARAVHVEQASGTGALPLLSTPATLSLTSVARQ